ncbi:MAG: hypothetical protein HQ559_09815, partial [Lentisphaerae bacterium]|nr:hypothetical protein [Lentisphaerota bacterium]
MSGRTKILAALGCAVLAAALAVVALVGDRPEAHEKPPVEMAPVKATEARATVSPAVAAVPEEVAEAAVREEAPKEANEESWPTFKKTPRGTVRSAQLKKASRPPQLPVSMSDEEKLSLKRRGVLTNSGRAMQVLRRDSSVILLRNAIIDTQVIAEGGPSVEIPEEYRAAENTEHFIVHFSDAISAVQKEALAEAGAVIEHYLPNRAFVVTAGTDAMAAIRSMKGVDYVEAYHPYFK